MMCCFGRKITTVSTVLQSGLFFPRNIDPDGKLSTTRRGPDLTGIPLRQIPNVRNEVALRNGFLPKPFEVVTSPNTLKHPFLSSFGSSEANDAVRLILDNREFFPDVAVRGSRIQDWMERIYLRTITTILRTTKGNRPVRLRQNMISPQEFPEAPEYFMADAAITYDPWPKRANEPGERVAALVLPKPGEILRRVNWSQPYPNAEVQGHAREARTLATMYKTNRIIFYDGSCLVRFVFNNSDKPGEKDIASISCLYSDQADHLALRFLLVTVCEGIDLIYGGTGW
ncbi:hypothetical protein KEM55_008979, partial [Ascosphaera atra]